MNLTVHTSHLIVLLFMLTIVGCDNQVSESNDSSAAAETKTQKTAHKDAEIVWYDGTIEDAFAKAEAEDTPLFFYWGAVWCPPCQEIKHTVFKSQEFIQLTKLFIPVYLDGDTDRAQSWGDKFEVKGYPTMIVFNPAGEEVTRIPGGIDISKYNSVLELSLNQMKPTRELVEQALADASTLTEADFYQLAYYSWGQDSVAVPKDTDKVSLFYDLAEAAFDEEMKARFYMGYVVYAARKYEAATEEKEEVPAPLKEHDDLYLGLTGVLKSDELTLAVWDTIAYFADDVLDLPVFSDAQRAELETLWSEQVFDLRFDESLSKAEKMAGWLPTLYLAARDEGELEDALKAQLIAEMQAVDQATPDSYERQSVINQMSYIYRQAGLKDEAKNLLLAELDKSASPYYFMSGLASMAQRDENNEEAIEWRRKAYENSKGEATRFQWGANYVRTMIKLSPEASDSITTQSLALLDEFKDPKDMLTGRNFSILKRLNKELAAWQEAQSVSEFAFGSRVKTLCETQAPETLEADNCRAMLEQEAVAQAS